MLVTISSLDDPFSSFYTIIFKETITITGPSYFFAAPLNSYCKIRGILNTPINY